MKRVIVSGLLSVFVVFAFLGCRQEEDVENMRVPRLMLESRGVDYGNMTGSTLTLPVSGTVVRVLKDPVVNEFEIINVEMVKVDLGLAMLVETTDKGGRELYRKTVTNKGGRIVLTVNDNPIGARRIDRAISDAKFYTFVEVDDDELGQLVLDIKESLAYIHSKRP